MVLTTSITSPSLAAGIGKAAASDITKQYPLLAKITYNNSSPLKQFNATNRGDFLKIMVGMIQRDYDNDKKTFEAYAQELERLMDANKKGISADTFTFVQEGLSATRIKWHTSSSSSASE